VLHDAVVAPVRLRSLSVAVKQISGGRRYFSAVDERVGDVDPVQCTVELMKLVKCGGRR
jgi:hypothetical protein